MHRRATNAFPASTLTIAFGAIAPTQGQHLVDTEAAAASDDLDTITVGSFSRGALLLLQAVAAARDVVIKNGTGNIVTASGSDVTLGTLNDMFLCSYNGTNWVQITGSGGATTLDGLTDVNTTGVATNDALAYDGASWVPTDALLPTTMRIGGNYTQGGITPVLQVNADDNTAVIGAFRAETAANGARVTLTKARGTRASQSVIAANDVVGAVDWYAHDGTDTVSQIGSLKLRQIGSPGLNSLTGNMEFQVANAADTPTKQAQLESTGGFLIAAGVAVPAGGTTGIGLKMSTTSNLGVFFGSGAPSLSAAKGSLYLRTDGSGTTDRAYINTNGTTGWTALTTAA